jgi:hypothetical protein
VVVEPHHPPSSSFDSLSERELKRRAAKVRFASSPLAMRIRAICASLQAFLVEYQTEASNPSHVAYSSSVGPARDINIIPSNNASSSTGEPLAQGMRDIGVVLGASLEDRRA